MQRWLRGVVWLPCAALVIGSAGSAKAQGRKTIVLGVITADSTAMLVPDAEIVILEGLATVLARNKSDSAGFARLSFMTSAPAVQLTVRRIGFESVARFLDFTAVDTIATVVQLERHLQELDTVSVLAAADPKRKSYFIDADAIVASGRPVYSAMDIIVHLRPDIVTSRAPDACADSTGPRPGKRTRHPPTGGIANVWVNGLRVRLVEASPWTRVPDMREAFIRREILDILGEIHPEHISEITYTDCFDKTVPVIGGQSAVFIRLKDGVGYERGRGSFVIPTKPPA